MPVSLRQVSADLSPAPPEPFHAPLFHDLVARLDEDQRHDVLDLGAASTSMLAMLGRTRCRVEIADLAHFGGIARLNSTEPGPELAGVAESLLPGRLSDDGIELVFCWDLLNYLTLNALSALMKAIGGRARPGAIAHALICYADRDMREEPGHLVPIENGALIDRLDTGALIAAPRYSPEELGRHMGSFVIDRARLLSNGMQEFLFRLES